MIGSIVDARYELLERIGEGTFFTVFKGQDRVIDRPVAVKLLYPRYEANAEFVGRLRSELTAASNLSHHAIARVYEVGDDNGSTYVATEYIRGGNLKDRIRRSAPFSFSEAVDLAISIADALAFAHRAGFTHGDVTPQNVLVTPEMQVKITDFGVSRAAVGSALVQSNAMLRGVHYLAPEVAEGQEPTPASDTYALGVMLFEMLTGTLPYQGDTPLAVALKHAQEPVPSPRALNPSVPRSLEGIVMKALAKNPADRYSSAFALLTDLRRAQECIRLGRPLTWTPLEQQQQPTAPVQPQTKAVAVKPAGRDFWRIAQNTLLLVVLGLLLFIFLSLFGGLGTPPDVTVPDVTGKTQADAETILQKAGLKLVVVSHAHDPQFAPGTVRTTLGAGNQVKQGTDVRVVLSDGPEMITVPELRNVRESDARRQLEKVGLRAGPTRRDFDDQVAKGHVSALDPAPGKQVPQNSEVILTVSRGPYVPSEDPSATSPDGSTEPSPNAQPDENDPSSTRSTRRHGRSQHWDVTVDVPPDGTEKQTVRIVVVEGDQETEAYKGEHAPGEKVTETVRTRGPATIRVFIGDRLLQEQQVGQPSSGQPE